MKRHRKRKREEYFEFYGLVGNDWPIYRLRARRTQRGWRIAIHYTTGEAWEHSESKTCANIRERDFYLDVSRDRVTGNGFMRLPYCPPYVRNIGKPKRKEPHNEE